MPPRPSVGQAEAPLASPCPPSNHTITLNLTLTCHVDLVEQDQWLLFATSLLSILDSNTNFDPSLGLEPGLRLGLSFGRLWRPCTLEGGTFDN